jgi:hypothetical protein
MPPSSRTRWRANRLVLPLTGALVALLGFAGSAEAAATPAQKVPFTQTNRDCDGAVTGGPLTRSFGFANITKTGSEKLVVTVALKNATPDTTYNIRLIQIVTGNPDAEPDCDVIDGTVTTDALGDGNTNIQEPVLPSARTAWVDLNDKDNFTRFFTTQVVSF